MRRLLVWELYQKLRAPGQAVLLEGTGKESRDYLAIEDVVSALLGLADKREELRGFLVINIGRGEETSIAHLADEMRKLVGPDKVVQFAGRKRPGDPLRWRADVSRLRSYLPWWNPQPLSASLGECVRMWIEREVPSFAS